MGKTPSSIFESGGDLDVSSFAPKSVERLNENATANSLGKGRPKAIVRRQAIDHANTIAVKAMMICRVSLSVMAVTPTGVGLLNISLRQAL